MLEPIRDLINDLSFLARKVLPPLRFNPYSERLGSSSIRQSDFPDWLAEQLSEDSLRDCLFYKWILNQVPLEFAEERMDVLDLGSMNFFYSISLAQHLKEKASKGFSLTGLEVDPFRIYRNLYRRHDYAHYYISLARRLVPEAEISYVRGNWLKWDRRQHFHLITCFFPFLFEDLHQSWGLSLRSFGPREYLSKAFAQSDQVLLFHQGEEECTRAKELLALVPEARICFEAKLHENPWVQRRFPVHVLLCQSNTSKN